MYYLRQHHVPVWEFFSQPEPMRQAALAFALEELDRSRRELEELEQRKGR